MKIIAWNCRRSLSKNLTVLLSTTDADLYIISEANQIKNYQAELQKFDYIYEVIPNAKNGVLILCKPGHSLKKLNFNNYYLNYFVPFEFDGMKIMGVWVKDNYIEDMVTYMAINLMKLRDFIIVGDFNSNYQWNAKHGIRSHAEFNKLMAQINHVSLYHEQTQEPFGEEITPTFAMKRNGQYRFYHIDYCYLPKQLVSKAVMTIGSADTWLNYSDHLPLIININN